MSEVANEVGEDIPLLTVAEVAAMLNVTERWVYDAVVRYRNPLPSMKVGHFRRFRRSEVLAWLDRQAR